ncbi:protein artemis-like isoform X2 [Oscarella lobularis]|uniref:protein artemis-like isoform X2 n=1 Tax=Oscarella lobularis TaxID=121494 RepID=UPI0033137E08
MSVFDGRVREYSGVIVDSFTKENCYRYGRAFFLSHCHKDHMDGLGARHIVHALENGCKGLFCSPVTASLLEADPDLAHLKHHIKPLAVNQPIIVDVKFENAREAEFLTVTLLSANHCPGSVMFLFEGRHGAVLYSGDFRLTADDVRKMEHLHLANGTCKSLRTMYLDTTFLHPNLACIPTRETSRRIAIDLIEQWKSENPAVHFVHMNCNSFGYEHVLLEVAEKFNTQIHVHPSTYASYTALPDITKYLTTDPRSTWIHACCWKLYKRQGVSIPCGILAPPVNGKHQVLRLKLTTMWFTKLPDGFPKDHKFYLPKFNIWRIVHSMHSSYNEICDVVGYLKPTSAYPTVIPVLSRTTQDAMKRLRDVFPHLTLAKEAECFSPPVSLLRPGLWSSRRKMQNESYSDTSLLGSSSPSASPLVKKKRKSLSLKKSTPVIDLQVDLSDSDDEIKIHSRTGSLPIDEVEPAASDCEDDSWHVDCSPEISPKEPATRTLGNLFDMIFQDGHIELKKK